MSSCNPTPTLTTVFPAVASETTVTSFTVVLQEQPDGECSSDSVSVLEVLFSLSLFALHSRVVYPRLVVLIHLQVIS